MLALVLALLLAPAAGPPPVFVDKGACPSECCGYGDWTATKAVHVVEKPTPTAPVVGTIPAGTTITAVTGHVVTRAGRFRVHRSWAPYKPGDVIFVYTYLGEGHFKVWFKGAFGEEDLGFSPYGGTSGARCEEPPHCWGTLESAHQSTWWVQVLLPDGRRAWTRETHKFSGKGGCG